MEVQYELVPLDDWFALTSNTAESVLHSIAPPRGLIPCGR